MGYVPAALRNYLVRLGWSHGDQEIFSTQEMIDAFDLPAIGRSAARFDFAKLENLNGHYIRHADDQSLVTMFEDVLSYVPDGSELKAKLNDTTRAQLLQAMPDLKERAKTLVELIDSVIFHLRRPAAGDRAESGGAADAGNPGIDRQTSRRAGNRIAVDRGNHRSRHARPSRKRTISSSAPSRSRCGWR